MTSRLPNGCEVECDLSDFIQRQIYFLGVFEVLESFLFSRLLQPGQIVIDAGANIGQYTLLAASGVGPSGEVHSFEPVPNTFSTLERYVVRSGFTSVRLSQSALWNENGSIALGKGISEKESSGTWTAAPGAAGCADGEITARAVRLDDYVAERGIKRVDVLKMDIEGAEPLALAGAAETLRKFHPFILIEVNRRRLLQLGSSPQALWDQLSELGYRGWKIGGSPRRCRPVHDFENIELENFIFHHKDLPANVTGNWKSRTPRRWACGGW